MSSGDQSERGKCRNAQYQGHRRQNRNRHRTTPLLSPKMNPAMSIRAVSSGRGAVPACSGTLL